MSEAKKPDENAALEQIHALLEMAQAKADEIINNAVDKATKIIEDAKVSKPASEPNRRPVKQEPKVKVKLVYDKTKNNADLPVSVNGKTYLVQRGVWVEVPQSVAEVIDNSLRQEEYAIRYADGLADAFAAKLKDL